MKRQNPNAVLQNVQIQNSERLSPIYNPPAADISSIFFQKKEDKKSTYTGI
jgi:hypothetical protein